MNLLDSKSYVSQKSFSSFAEIIKKDKKKADKYLAVVADLLRYNTLLCVSKAGTGHLGASLSIIELLTEIYFRSFNFQKKSKDNQNRDIFILSKGHAVPALYSTLSAKNYFPSKDLDFLRRLDGLPGHPDKAIPGIEANTGSLAMGLSKAVGHALAKKRFGKKGKVIVIIGDGEIQEGQCWEAFLSASHFKLDNLFIVIDQNQVQTDQYTGQILKLNNLEKTLQYLGFEVVVSKARKVKEIKKSFDILKKVKFKPKVFIAKTIKGQGISFMEHGNVLKNKKDRYIWHNKAPDKRQLKIALDEIFERISKILKKHNFSWKLESAYVDVPKEKMQKDIKGDNLVNAFSRSLVQMAKTNTKIVVLDADLESDCGFSLFRRNFPKRFFELGIMEQHMASTASSFSRLSYIPVFSSYVAFLTARANEQIYNLVTEGQRAIIVGSMPGLIPATPGKSHIGFRDISCMKNIPGILMYQPITAKDVANILNRYQKRSLGKIIYLRLSMVSSSRKLKTPAKNHTVGTPQILVKGKEAIVVGIGPVILGECLKAARKLKKEKINLQVLNHPWLSDFDKDYYQKLSKRNIPLLVVEDHSKKGGFGEGLLSFLALNNIKFSKIQHISVEDMPETGFREEILQKYSLDYNSIASNVRHLIKSNK